MATLKAPKEVEIKFRIEAVRRLTHRLTRTGFHLVTRRTHELNALYDLPGHPLRRRGQLLRLRQYGSQWTLTHKAKAQPGRHKTRVERETKLQNGPEMGAILRALGFVPSFRYEKFRAEWSDGRGHVVIDETPIGNFGEIEGPARWIDSTAKRLDIHPEQYITQSYAELFFAWKQRTGSPAKEMTFVAVTRQRP